MERGHDPGYDKRSNTKRFIIKCFFRQDQVNIRSTQFILWTKVSPHISYDVMYSKERPWENAADVQPMWLIAAANIVWIQDYCRVALDWCLNATEFTGVLVELVRR